MRLQAPRGGCRIRMYRQGLGDCFLLTFTAGNGQERYVLVDCGVLTGTGDAAEVMPAVVRDVHASTDGRLDALVLTHEHWDHISGLHQAREEFERLEVEELWLAWTEDPHDAFAVDLQRRGREALKTLRAALAAFDDGSPEADRIARVLAFGDDLLGADGRTSTADVFAWAKQRWPAHRYCRPGDTLSISGIPQVRFRVLGPPEEKALLKKSRPSTSQPETYLADPARAWADLRAALAGRGAAFDDAGPGAEACRPFGPPYYGVASSERLRALRERYEAEPWRRIDQDWLGASADLAVRLDEHTNNSSLVLAIELTPGGKTLLFAADAQVGNWRSWHDVSFTEEGHELTARDLLGRTVLYKVGHHGSHNATLSDLGLELMDHRDLAAMIPVDRDMARKRRWKMPYGPLADRLRERTAGRVILADAGPPDDPDVVFPGTVETGDLWIDYVLEP